MTLQKQGDFTFNHSDQQDDLYEIMTSLQVKQAFDSRAKELQATLNTLIDSLQSIVDGDSGADNIGATAIADLNGTNVQTLLENLRNILKSTVDGASGADFVNSTSINGVTGTTVQSQLKSLKTLIDGVFTKNDLQGTSGAGKIGTSPISGVSGITVQDMLASLKASINQTVLGQIPDGSISEQKLSFEPATQLELDEHKADDAIDAHNATNISIVDSTNKFTATDVEGALSELFTNANNLKSDWAGVVGSPLLTTDTSAQLKSKTQTIKNDLATHLTSKGQSSLGTEVLASLVAKVASITTGKKWASGTTQASNVNIVVTRLSTTSQDYKDKLEFSGLDFTPNIVICQNSRSEWTFAFRSTPFSNFNNRIFTIILSGDGISGTAYKLQSPANMYSGGFLIPLNAQAGTWGGYTNNWIAIE